MVDLDDYTSGCFAHHHASAFQKVIAKEMGLHSELGEIDSVYEVQVFDVTPKELRTLKKLERYFQELT